MSKEQIEIIKKIFVEESQPIYNSWNQDQGYDNIFGEGGICDTIAETVVEVLLSIGYETGIISKHSPIPHSWVWVEIGEKKYEFDIPYSIYESYISDNCNYPKFQKIDNILFEPSDVITIESGNLKSEKIKV